jgi:hypothetical protein
MLQKLNRVQGEIVMIILVGYLSVYAWGYKSGFMIFPITCSLVILFSIVSLICRWNKK